MAERKAEEREPAAGQVENPSQCRRRMVQSQGGFEVDLTGQGDQRLLPLAMAVDGEL
ncbi:hypothetical protein [Streptomyces sp. NBC_01092]|uniref:hypothetical protein n=1 Tax=Streptomyces sp. NBC_01092 TaxID=2903748 RepID=UPI003868EEB9|nr:hypothetical protein OG254_17575 [Streptomyces sp. NBC_01092]